MLVYRIVHKKFSNTLHASGIEGRWNGKGRKVIYAGSTVEIAFLENMVRRQGVGFNRDFRTMIIEIPEAVKISKIPLKDLTAGWRDFRDYSVCQKLGNEWYDKKATAVLKVPSAVLSEAFNYVINTEHPDFTKIKVIATLDLIPDPRIEEILKRNK